MIAGLRSSCIKGTTSSFFEFKQSFVPGDQNEFLPLIVMKPSPLGDIPAKEILNPSILPE
jgi:hypothetical protein